MPRPVPVTLIGDVASAAVLNTAWASCTAGCRCTPHHFGSTFCASSAAAPNPVMSEPLCGSGAAAGSQRHRRSETPARRRSSPASPPISDNIRSMPEARESQGGLGGFIRRSGLPAQVADPRHRDRHHRGPGRGGLLPDARLRRPVPARVPRRLRRANGVRRRRRQGVARLRPAMGHPADHAGRRAGVRVHRRQARPGGRGPRHRQRDRSRAYRPAGDQGARSAGQDGDERADDRLRRFGWPRRPDSADLRGLRLAAHPLAGPVRRGRPRRGVDRHRLGHRCDLRRAARRRGAGGVDRLPRGLRLPLADTGLHHLGHGVRDLRLDPRLRAAVRFHRARLPLRRPPARLVPGDRNRLGRNRIPLRPGRSTAPSR